MRTFRYTAGVLGIAALAILLPASAQGRTWKVAMGTPPGSQNSFQSSGADVNDFFPHGARIHVGDKVKFLPVGFHTVNFPATGEDPDALVTPGGNAIAGVNDEAGQPVWFNGQPELGFNPALFATLFGKTVAFNGHKSVESGLPLARHPKPMTVKFKRPGHYTYYCSVHPGMKGKLTVSRRGHSVPSAKRFKRSVKRQVKRDVKIAKRLSKKQVPAGTVDVGVAGPHGVEYYGMLPGSITVPVGTTLNFRMTPGSFEDHTASFGPGNPEADPSSYLGVLAASFNAPVFDQRAVYPSEPPGTTATLTPALHGNGFWNTGVMDNGIATPLPASNSVTFGAPGTYDYYCLIHPFMHGRVVVQ